MLALHKDRPLLAGFLLLAMGFVLQGCAGDSPQSVAERFWEAARARDIETVEALSVHSEDSNFNFDSDDTDVQGLHVGETSVDGDRAEAQTEIEIRGDEMDLDVEFVTVLTRQNGEWLVDMDETTDEIMKAVIGASMAELGEAIGEGMSDAMEGLAEGLAEGMEEMAEAFGDAAKEMKKSR